jgi:drug/metabolite transporter (DMT)-like permease
MKKNATISYLSLILGIIFLSISPLFVRWADAPGVVTSFFRMTTVVIITGLIFLIGKKPVVNQRISKKLWLLPILGGIFSGIDHTLWSTSIESTYVANATLLNYIAPLWVGLVAIFILREKYKSYFWAGMALVLAGAWIISGVNFSDLSTFSMRGEGFAIISSIFYAGYFIFSQRSRKHFPVLSYLLISSFAAMSVLLIIIISTGKTLFGYSGNTYLLFLLAGIISQFGGYYCINYALGEIPASIVSAVLILQPVLTALLAAQFVGEPIGVGQLLGGGLVLVGVYILNLSKQSEATA